MTHPMLTWLEAVLTEDETSAREGHIYSWHTRLCGNQPVSAMFGDCECDVPAAVLADIASKRALLDLHTPRFPEDEDYRSCPSCMKDWTDGQWEPFPCPTVRALVSAFATREGYSLDWGPT